MASYSSFTVKKEIQEQTNRYRYRKQNTPLKKHEIVIIGDSVIAGGGLAQEEMFFEVLEERLGVSVYSYAPHRISNVLKDAQI